MKTKIQNKMERFLELSSKFSKSAEDVFGKEDLSMSLSGTLHFSDCVSGTYTIGETLKQSTRAERILQEAHDKARLADELDEYTQLRKDLTDYFKALNKLK